MARIFKKISRRRQSAYHYTDKKKDKTRCAQTNLLFSVISGFGLLPRCICTHKCGAGNVIYFPCSKNFANSTTDCECRFLMAEKEGFTSHILDVWPQFAVTRKNHRAYAFPRFFRPLHKPPLTASAPGGARVQILKIFINKNKRHTLWCVFCF